MYIYIIYIWTKHWLKCKACVRYYFVFLPNDSPSKTMKNAFYLI